MREKFSNLCSRTWFRKAWTRHKHIESYFAPLGAEEVKILYFELNGYGAENVAMATKFLRFFACFKFFHLYANFYLILINTILIIAHLYI